jgi:hypothetical protein
MADRRTPGPIRVLLNLIAIIGVAATLTGLVQYQLGILILIAAPIYFLWEISPWITQNVRRFPRMSLVAFIFVGALIGAGGWVAWHRLGARPSPQVHTPPSVSTETTPSFLFVIGIPLGDNDSPVWVMLLRHYGPEPAYNCTISFYDDDRKNIEHKWLVDHPDSSFLPPGGIVGESQKHIHIPEGGPLGAIGNFQWNPLEPNSQHYTVSISCRAGVFVEKWQVTRVDGILRSSITLEHGPQWIKNNPTANPVIFSCVDPEFVPTSLADKIPKPRPMKAVNPGFKPNHRFEVPVAIIDPNGNLQVVSSLNNPDGSVRSDFGCWSILSRHLGDKPQ